MNDMSLISSEERSNLTRSFCRTAWRVHIKRPSVFSTCAVSPQSSPSLLPPMMSERGLPEELLREILVICLEVAPSDFFRFPTLQDNTRSPTRNTDLLLVSKRWLRVCTPLLYTSLRLREPSHAVSTAALLSENPGLGNAIINLRIEGDCGASLVDVLKLTPRVQRLYIAADKESNRDAESLRRALPYISPKELFLVDMTRVMRSFGLFPWARGISADEAICVVEHAIAHYWTALVRQDFISFNILQNFANYQRCAQRTVHFGPYFIISPNMSLALDAVHDSGSETCISPLRAAVQVVLWGLDGSAMR